MAVSKAQQRAVAKYMAANYDEVKIRIPKGRNESINGFLNGLIRETLCMTEEEWKKHSEEAE